MRLSITCHPPVLFLHKLIEIYVQCMLSLIVEIISVSDRNNNRKYTFSVVQASCSHGIYINVRIWDSTLHDANVTHYYITLRYVVSTYLLHVNHIT